MNIHVESKIIFANTYKLNILATKPFTTYKDSR